MLPHTLTQPPAASLDLAQGRCLLFAYGKLQPHQNAPKSLTRAWPDQVRGLLYDLGAYPAAVEIGTVDRWFNGYVLEIAEAELADSLDSYEEVDKGLYRRIRTVTRSGFDVWIYEYARAVPKNAIGLIDRWPT